MKILGQVLTQPLTITLLKDEGIGMIVSFTADKEQAREGEEIVFSFVLRNDGLRADTLWAQIIDNDTNEIIMDIVEFPSVAPGVTAGYTVPVKIMPNKSWNLLLSGGHVE